MPDDISVNPSAAGTAVPIAADELTELNGQATTPDQNGRRPKAQRLKIIHGPDGQGTDTSDAAPFPVTDAALATALGALMTELGQKLEPGQAVELGATSLAALETVTVGGSVAVSQEGDVAGTLTSGRKTVAAPGTAEALRASLACKWVTVTALKTNTQQVNAGGAGVLATAGGSTGDPLGPGESMTYPISNANLVFVDARVAGEGVSFTVGS